MISFQWKDVSIAVNQSGQLHIHGTAPATADSLSALGEVLMAMSVLLDEEAETEELFDEGASTSDAPTSAAAPQTAAPQTAAPQTAAPQTAASQTAVPSTQASTAPGPLTKPGPRQTAAWLAGDLPAPTPAQAASPAAAMPAAAMPAASAPAAPATSPAPARPVEPAPASPAPIGRATIAIPGLVKPGPKRTAAFLNGEAPDEASALNEGLMASSNEAVSKPGPMQTQAFLASAGNVTTGAQLAVDTASSQADEPAAAATAEEVSAGAATAAPNEKAAESEAKEAEVARRTPKGQLLREMTRWLEQRGAPATVAEIVAQAEAEAWSFAANVEPAVVSTLRRNAKIFLRNPDGSFGLRAARGPGKVVRRRAVRHPDDV